MKTQVCRLCQQVCMSMSVCMGGEIFFFRGGGGVYVEVKDVKVFSFFYVLLMELNIGVFSS